MTLWPSPMDDGYLLAQCTWKIGCHPSKIRCNRLRYLAMYLDISRLNSCRSIKSLTQKGNK